MFGDNGFGGMGFGGMGNPNNFPNKPNNPNGKTDDFLRAALQVIKGLCLLGLCFLVLVVLVKVIPSLGDMIAEWILSFFRRIRFGSGTDGVIGLGMVLIFLIGIAKLFSNHFRN